MYTHHTYIVYYSVHSLWLDCKIMIRNILVAWLDGASFVLRTNIYEKADDPRRIGQCE